jgi:hypothetical protein
MGVPRYLYRTFLRSAADMLKSKLAGQEAASFDHELWLCFFLGVWLQRWRDRHMPFAVMTDVRIYSNREAVIQSSTDKGRRNSEEEGR